MSERKYTLTQLRAAWGAGRNAGTATPPKRAKVFPPILIDQLAAMVEKHGPVLAFSMHGPRYGEVMTVVGMVGCFEKEAGLCELCELTAERLKDTQMGDYAVAVLEQRCEEWLDRHARYLATGTP